MDHTKTRKNSKDVSRKSIVYKLMLYDDNVNTFDHVIDSLIRVCGHNKEQAEQCTLLVHYKGKCDVKNGSLKQLVPLLTSLCSKGLTAEIIE